VNDVSGVDVGIQVAMEFSKPADLCQVIGIQATLGDGLTILLGI